ncbi:MAG TPA: hypothetical protein VMY36_00220 [Patescibacteria group bacterium]|nr:hypothetical protein [Patescibacteria group bacterium]
MDKQSQTKKEEKPLENRLGFGRKKLGYRTPKSFRRQTFRRNPALTAQRPRSLGGHQ